MKYLIVTFLIGSGVLVQAQQSINEPDKDSVTTLVKITWSIDPLYLLDNVEITKGEFKNISPDKIKSVQVLTDPKSLELYVEKG